MQMPPDLTVEPNQRLTCDVVVVGGGGAGLRAALAASHAGADVIVVNKGKVTSSGATAVGIASHAGFAVPDGAADPTDNPDTFFDEVMDAGAGCADPNLVRTLAEDAVSAAEKLEALGVEFMSDPETGKTLVNQGDYANRARNRKIFGHGKSITVGLKRELDVTDTRFLEHMTVADLTYDDNGRICGVLCLSHNNELIDITAGAVVLATGGAGQLFGKSLMPTDIMGDGYGLGLKAGARLANMEFVQCGFGLVGSIRGMVMPWTWWLDLKLTDREGRSILDGYVPAGKTEADLFRDKARHYPFSTIDSSMWIEIAAKKALDEGRLTEDGLMDMDMTHVKHSDFEPGTIVSQMWPSTKDWFAERRVDVTQERVQVGLFGHAINGGIVISPDGETEIDGLFAVGEAAAGPYGADRLGGHMLLTTQVFGERAGRRAAEIARVRSRKPGRPRAGPKFNEAGASVDEVHARIKATMDRDVLIVRSEATLERASREMQNIRDEVSERGLAANTIKHQHKAFSIENLILSGQALVAAAAQRRETRGTHYREDFPHQDPNSARPIFVTNAETGPFAAFGSYKDKN
ncbi:FAD-binding protein [Cognatishimia activa]|uniref:FAD-binding protein n=1 Tax=Cognatishimia activa TaxID=1715691 RepID=UPI0022325746|nr:FAD-binding protein [Cognatishimia activa]UZD91276.1 FAD-binding protein [Cognatishimia activa]